MEKIIAGIITVSDRSSKGEREDLSGPEIRKWAEKNDILVKEEAIVPDEIDQIEAKLIELSDKGIELLLTTGGTGFAPRDVTPEATKKVIEREAPGFAEAMRMRSLEITPHAMLSRAVSGIRKNTLIINLPGSPKGARENLQFIEKAIPHAIDLLRNRVTDCGGL
ncbi:MAG TPA: molybdopterin adenylyltransferase [Spirochaetota bacterium]|nr:molybdopterin adenylyltransferase [Spirochaetota bacterium]HPJ33273.1 molybdopterin adenylyltransferase [Spirochaetota bacterium]